MNDTEITLLLLRHGNTFAPGDKVVMVGAAQDLPLVARGREQAEIVRDSMRLVRPKVYRYYAAPLRRTMEFAEIVAEGAAVRSDPRLRELDYGAWSMLEDDEVIARFGGEALRAWRERGVWPEAAGFGESDDAVRARVLAFAREVEAETPRGAIVVAVSSQGVLRYFLHLVEGAFAARAAVRGLAVGTGKGSVLRCEGGAWRLSGWNLSVAELSGVLNPCAVLLS